MDKMEDRGLRKIAIIGAESTGKTQLCEELAQHYHTQWVPEYAREYFNNSDIYNYTLKDLEIIAEKQVEWEHKTFEKANNFLFCDTALLTLKIWAELEFGTCPNSIKELINKNPYDHFLITNNDVEWEKDPQRLNKYSRQLIYEMNRKEAEKSGKTFSLITGKGRERSQIAIRGIFDLYGI